LSTVSSTDSPTTSSTDSPTASSTDSSTVRLIQLGSNRAICQMVWMMYPASAPRAKETPTRFPDHDYQDDGDRDQCAVCEVDEGVDTCRIRTRTCPGGG